MHWENLYIFMLSYEAYMILPNCIIFIYILAPRPTISFLSCLLKNQNRGACCDVITHWMVMYHYLVFPKMSFAYKFYIIWKFTIICKWIKNPDFCAANFIPKLYIEYTKLNHLFQWMNDVHFWKYYVYLGHILCSICTFFDNYVHFMKLSWFHCISCKNMLCFSFIESF